MRALVTLIATRNVPLYALPFPSAQAKEESVRGRVEVPLQRGLEEEVASEER